jgi:menaquinone-dependent protoporphyrinogen IX oxidase
MNDERYSIIYSSRTGNTRLLAEAILCTPLKVSSAPAASA